MDAEDRALFDRSLHHAATEHSGEALDAELEALGWFDALAAEPATAVSLLFEHQGAANATSSALDRLLGDGLGTPTKGVVLPALGRHEPPGAVTAGGLDVRGLGTATLRSAETVVVVTTTGGGTALATVDASALDLRPVQGLDPGLGLVEVAADGLPADNVPLDPEVWADTVAAGQRAVAHELVGAARAMLALARDHAVERVQFGRPIGRFQAVRHRLAESLVAVEAADGAVGAAWEDGSPLTAALAKAIAGRSGRTVARHAQQVLAGVGFTTEHPLHRYVRRTIALDGLLGDARGLTIELGQQLLAERELPGLLTL